MNLLLIDQVNYYFEKGYLYSIISNITTYNKKLVENKNPKFSNPVGKGASLFLAIQLFAYKTFENSIIKNVTKYKIK